MQQCRPARQRASSTPAHSSLALAVAGINNQQAACFPDSPRAALVLFLLQALGKSVVGGQ